MKISSIVGRSSRSTEKRAHFTPAAMGPSRHEDNRLHLSRLCIAPQPLELEQTTWCDFICTFVLVNDLF